MYPFLGVMSFPQLVNVMCHQSCGIRKYLYLTLNHIMRNYCILKIPFIYNIFCDSYFQHSQLTYTQDCYQLNNIKDLIVHYCICQTSSLHREHAHWLPPGPSYH